MHATPAPSSTPEWLRPPPPQERYITCSSETQQHSSGGIHADADRAASSASAFAAPATTPSGVTNTSLLNSRRDVIEVLQGVVPPILLEHMAMQQATILTLGNKQLPMIRLRGKVRVGKLDILPHTYVAESATYLCEDVAIHRQPSAVALARSTRRMPGNVYRLNRMATSAFQRR